MTDTPEFKPGVYFDMPEDQYHATPALSASGIKNLLVSPLDFWTKASWLNPDFESEEKEHFNVGKAWDTYICEGPDAFNAQFATYLDKSDYPDALDTIEDLKCALDAEGEKKSGSKPVLIERLLAANPNAPILSHIQKQYAIDNAGKTFISFDDMAAIKKSAAIIFAHDQLKQCFTGGYPQVTVMWHDEEFGVDMKCRFDYLKPAAIIDLKTFTNTRNMPIDRAINSAMGTYKYHIQAGLYLRAFDRAVEMMMAGDPRNPPKTPLFDCSIDVVERFKGIDRDKRIFVFVFQQKGPVPNTRGKIFPRYQAYETALVQIRDAAQIYKDHMAHFGNAPWIDLSTIENFHDEDFPPWAFE